MSKWLNQIERLLWVMRFLIVGAFCIAVLIQDLFISRKYN